MVCCHNVGIEDQTMESPSCYCEVEEKEQDDQKYTSKGYWNEQNQVNITALFALGAAQDKTKSFFTFPTQQPRTVDIALLVRVPQVDILALSGTVVKWTERVMGETFKSSIVI